MNYTERLDLAVQVAVAAVLAQRAADRARDLYQPPSGEDDPVLVNRSAEHRAVDLIKRAEEALDALNDAMERSGDFDETLTLEWIGCDEETFRRAIEQALDREAP
jgi:hypothetical protein